VKESRIYKHLLLSFLLLLVSYTTSACSFFESKDKDFRESIPIGTFTGIGIPIEPGAEVLAKAEENLSEENKADNSAPNSTPVANDPKAADSKTNPAATPAPAAPNASPTNPQTANGNNPVPAAEGTNNTGTETSTATPAPIQAKPKPKYTGPKIDLLINLFPMDIAYRQGVGILRINNRSYKFNWESDSVSKTPDGNMLWNVSFTKDNNIYASLDENFSFTGVLEQKDTGLELYGTLSIKPTKAEEMLNYHVITSQEKTPIISASGELSVKAGEPITLEAEQSGTDKTVMKAYAESLDGKNKVELVIAALDKPEKGKKKNKLIINTDAAMIKGDYNISIVRDEKHFSNSLKVTIQ